jgi:repressor of nif and glnA expression
MVKEIRQKVLKIIEEDWPVNVSMVADKMKKKTGQKLTVQMLRYHFKKLDHDQKIITKKIGRNLVAWPSEIEKLRVLHEILR